MLEQPTIEYLSDELGKHFFDNMPSYRLLAYSYVRDMDVAEDMVSDSFIRLWEHKQDLQPDRGDYRPYIIQIIKNSCLQYLRLQNIHTKIENAICDNDAWKFQISINSLEAMDAEKRLFSSDVEAIVNRELEKMPRLTREIFTASRLKAKTHKEIAAEYDIPVRKVIWEIQRVLEVLRVSLKDYMPVFIALFCFMEYR